MVSDMSLTLPPGQQLLPSMNSMQFNKRPSASSELRSRISSCLNTMLRRKLSSAAKWKKPKLSLLAMTFRRKDNRWRSEWWDYLMHIQLQPGSVLQINHSLQNWHQLKPKAVVRYIINSWTCSRPISCLKVGTWCWYKCLFLWWKIQRGCSV